MCWGGYCLRFRRDEGGAVDGLRLGGNRIRNVLFVRTD